MTTANSHSAGTTAFGQILKNVKLSDAAKHKTAH